MAIHVCLLGLPGFVRTLEGQDRSTKCPHWPKAEVDALNTDVTPAVAKRRAEA